MDYSSNTYLAITLSPSSTTNPASLVASLSSGSYYVGQVGELADVHLVSVPKADWEQSQDQIVRTLRASVGVQRVDVQPEPKRRVKRDEF